MAQPNDPRQLGRAFAMAQVGFEMVAPIVLGLILDNQFRTGPWLTIVGAVLGLVGGLYHLVILGQKADEPPPDEPPPHEQP